MNVLVVFCHPSHESFSHRLLEACLETLRANGHAVAVRDLYAEDFRPVLSRAELAAYEDPAANQSDVSAYAGDLAWARAIVLVHPTWWYGMPAMLKGYFDRVWVPGVAFKLDAGRRVSASPLKHIERFVAVTTYGAAAWWIRLWMGDPERKAVMRSLRALFAPGCRMRWLALYDMDHCPARDRDRFAQRLRRELARL